MSISEEIPDNQPPSEGFEELIQSQLSLEKWWVKEQIESDRERANFLRERGRPEQDRGVRSLLVKLAEQLAFHIEDRVYSPKSKTGATQRTSKLIKDLLQSMEPFELAYLVLSRTASTVLTSDSGYTPFSTLSAVLAESLEQELRLRAMEQMEPDLKDVVRRVVSKSANSTVHRRRVFIKLFHDRVNTRVKSPFTNSESKILTGNALLELVVGTTMGATVAEPIKQYDQKKRESRWYVKASEQLRDLFYRNVDEAWMAARTNPLGVMLYKPGKRTTGTKEMLLTRDCDPIKVSPLAGKRKENRQDIIDNDRGYELLLKVLTFYEQTPFRVNQQMLSFVKSNKESLQRHGFLPMCRLNIPDCPVAERSEAPLTEREQEKLKEWKKVAEKEHNKYWKERMNVQKSNQVLKIATKLSSYDRFYYRWYADFRGRLYTLQHRLSVQGGSLSKSLLEFADPVPVAVGNNADRAWCEFIECGLRFISSNAKLPTPELLRATGGLSKQHLDELLGTLLREPGWEENLKSSVSKKDQLPFIAWLLELSRLLENWGSTVQTGHPIRKDATCSSMQHMSAMSGDNHILRLTNCQPAMSSIEDLYQNLIPDFKHKGLDRDQVKAFVMTFAYNSTDYTRKNDLQKKFEEEHGIVMPRREAVRINEELKSAATAGLGRIPTLQGLLMDVFNRVVVKDKNQAVSITPVGFAVDSTRYKYPSGVYRIALLDRTIRIRMFDADRMLDKVDMRRTRNSWVANIVHSMDACLLWVMVNCIADLKDRLDLATIHDCIVTRPGQMSRAVRALGYSFKHMYSPDPKNGLPLAVSKLMRWWGLASDYPDLYNRFCSELPGVDSEQFDDMRYFFV